MTNLPQVPVPRGLVSAPVTEDCIRLLCPASGVRRWITGMPSVLLTDDSSSSIIPSMSEIVLVLRIIFCELQQALFNVFTLVSSVSWLSSAFSETIWLSFSFMALAGVVLLTAAKQSFDCVASMATVNFTFFPLCFVFAWAAWYLKSISYGGRQTTRMS